MIHTHIRDEKVILVTLFRSYVFNMIKNLLNSWNIPIFVLTSGRVVDYLFHIFYFFCFFFFRKREAVFWFLADQADKLYCLVGRSLGLFM